jgi:hypothetical protein
MDVFDEAVVGFWKALNEKNVRYIMVGGFATNLMDIKGQRTI